MASPVQSQTAEFELPMAVLSPLNLGRFWRRPLGITGTSETGIALQGVGGLSPSVFLATTVEFTADDGTPARIHGQFASFTDPAAAETSILGRDILDHFDVILSRRQDEILLVAGAHRYVVT